MDGNGMDTEAGRIDVVSCGIGFPKDAETLGLIGRADVVYGSRALLAACPVEARLTRIIGAKARNVAEKHIQNVQTTERYRLYRREGCCFAVSERDGKTSSSCRTGKSDRI